MRFVDEQKKEQGGELQAAREYGKASQRFSVFVHPISSHNAWLGQAGKAT
jgi:hypothetical protein